MKNKLWRKGLVVAIIVLFVGAGVTPSIAGYDGNTIYVPDDYSTIQSAINNANAGDTIIVRDGTYIENVEVGSHHLTIMSEEGGNSSIVQAASNDHVFEVTADYVKIIGFMIAGGGAGIYLDNADYCIISNNNLYENSYGVWLDHSFNNKLINNVISTNYHGAKFWDADFNTLNDNTFSKNEGTGLMFYFCSGNFLNRNIISDNNELGLYFDHCSNHILTNNVISGHQMNLKIDTSSSFTMDTTNKVNGKPVQYLSNKQNVVINSNWDIGYLGIDHCENIRVEGLTLPSYNGEGIFVTHSTNCKIKNVKVGNNRNGIELYDSSFNTLENIATYDNFAGIYLLGSSHNKLINNNVFDNGRGISLGASHNNQVINNAVNSNGDGIFLSFSSNNNINGNTVTLNSHYGIAAYYYRSRYNTIKNNMVNSNMYGFYLVSEVSNNMILDNNVLNNIYGIYIHISSNNNFIYSNNFIDNVVNVASSGSTNTWKSNLPITYTYKGNTYTNYMGNYWDDYNGNDADEDGIGDTPYSIDEDNDYYPLMMQFENYFDDEGKILYIPFFSQLDDRWKDKTYDHTSDTIGNLGCALTCAAMISVYYGYDTNPDMLNTNLIETEGGYDNEGNLNWWKLYDVTNHKVKYEGKSGGGFTKIYEELSQGYPVIAHVCSPVSHFIIFIGRIGDKYYFLDPADRSRENNEWPNGAHGKYELCDYKPLRIFRGNPNMKVAKLNSPGELCVYDSRNRFTGLVNGEIREEIPNSIYENETNSVILFLPYDTYIYKVVGKEVGTYGLMISSYEEGNETVFTAVDIPTSDTATHQYIVNWTALSQGEEGVTLQIDSDGDGTFEKTITSDNELTQDEFILQTETVIDIDPDTLNLNSTGKWITCYIEFPIGYNVSDINISTILLNDTVSAENHPINISDYDNDSIPDLMVKFDRQDVIAILEPGDNVAITVTGKLFDETQFEGTDYIKVI